MRKVREVLRLKHEGRSHRQIAASVSIGEGTVSDYLARAKSAGVTWEIARELSDAEVEARLYRDHVGRNEPNARAPVDFAWVHRELPRVGVTLQTLWTEYRESLSSGVGAACAYQYSQFCELYARWRAQLSVSMRQVHRAGERAFVDYSGKKPRIVDAKTGEVTEVELFVMVMGASNYTFVEATHTQRLADFVGSTVRAFEYLGCVPEMLVPDQLRSAVSGPDRYEPDLNPTYLEMAQHYGVAVVPARPRKPKDKAKVEGGVLLAQRWVMAVLRNRTFFSLGALNEAIGELREKLNARPFQKLEGCRRSRFEAIDRPAMRALPARRYELAEWKKAKVNIDYLVGFEDRFYSVPYALIGARVEVRATGSTIEILHKGVRAASHARSYATKGTLVVNDEHRPRAHRDWRSWPPERVVSWAATSGPNVGQLATALLARHVHPEAGYRACLGVIRLGERYGAARLDAACARALAIASPSFKSVKAILKTGLDGTTRDAGREPSPPRAPFDHENIRGPAYFDKGGIDAERRDDSKVARPEDEPHGDDAAEDGRRPTNRTTVH